MKTSKTIIADRIKGKIDELNDLVIIAEGDIDDYESNIEDIESDIDSVCDDLGYCAKHGVEINNETSHLQEQSDAIEDIKNDISEKKELIKSYQKQLDKLNKKLTQLRQRTKVKK